jgi:hypothetical protein
MLMILLTQLLRKKNEQYLAKMKRSVDNYVLLSTPFSGISCAIVNLPQAQNAYLSYNIKPNLTSIVIKKKNYETATFYFYDNRFFIV